MHLTTGTAGALTRPQVRVLHCILQKSLSRGGRCCAAQLMSNSTAVHTPVVLVHNGELAPCTATSGTWLTTAPRGAYTTARTVQHSLVFKLSSHIQRLATSANLMVDADTRAADHLSADIPLFHSDVLRPLVVDSMQAAVQQLRRQPSAHDCEVKLTLLLTWDSSGAPDLYCHAEPLPSRPKPPVKLQVKGMPRVNAKAKDSEWVRQRKAWESSKPAGVNEVLLVTPEGQLLEGLTSNFFVLDSQGAVVTADEGVLNGTVRELVLEVCCEQGVPVVLQPPQLSEIDTWQGAFISSTSRLLLPACEVQYEQPHGQHRTKVFGQQHPLVLKLEAEVMAKVLSCSEPLESRGSKKSAAT